ncbi:MAG: hypothetical protein PHZ09_12940 [Eubacteriales bacterium]|jgi:hypothetical protein|nr:hypothetical protein [Eubacteriales bacterium]
MRNTDERVAAVRRRANDMERQKRIRHGCLVVMSCTAVCLLIAFALGAGVTVLIYYFRRKNDGEG